MLFDWAAPGLISNVAHRFIPGRSIDPDALETFGSDLGIDLESIDFEAINESWLEIAPQETEDTARAAILDDLSTFLEYEETSSLAPGFQQLSIQSGGQTQTANFQNYNRSDHFSIKYYDKYVGRGRHFQFALLPVVESSLMRGPGQTVPGASAGILIHTKMRHRAVLVPGGTPVYQSIGLESVEIRLCGLLSGDEEVVGESPGLGTFTDELFGRAVSGYDLAQFFRENVVIPGTPVDLDIFASSGHIDTSGAPLSELDSISGTVHITGKLLIKEFRTMSARATRDYYCIDGYLINYVLEKRADPEGTGAAADIEICEQRAEAYRAARAAGEKPEDVSPQCMRILSNAGLDVGDLNVPVEVSFDENSQPIQSVVDIVDVDLSQFGELSGEGVIDFRGEFDYRGEFNAIYDNLYLETEMRVNTPGHSVYVFSEPTSDSETVRTLNPGDVVSTTGEENGYSQIEGGWVLTSFLEEIEAQPKSPAQSAGTSGGPGDGEARFTQ